MSLSLPRRSAAAKVIGVSSSAPVSSAVKLSFTASGSSFAPTICTDTVVVSVAPVSSSIV